MEDSDKRLERDIATLARKTLDWETNGKIPQRKNNGHAKWSNRIDESSRTTVSYLMKNVAECHYGDEVTSLIPRKKDRFFYLQNIFPALTCFKKPAAAGSPAPKVGLSFLSWGTL